MIEVLNESLRSFIDSYIDSLLAWDIVLFLYNSSIKTGNASELAEHFGRSPVEVNQVLTRLKREGLVRSEGSHAPTKFVLSNNFKQKVEPFIAALDQRQQRLAILAEVLKREYAS